MRPWIALICLGLAARPVAGSEPLGTPDSVLSGLPITEVRIDAREIFDPTRPGEGHFLLGWANALHVRTRSNVIRRELLFRTGDAYDPARLAESERNLRSLGIFQDVALRARQGAGGVEIDVATWDRWATHLITDFRSEGDIYRLRLGLANTNLFGSARQLGGSVVASNDVNQADAFVRDPRLFGSRWDVHFAWAEDELGVVNHAALERPFYSVNQRCTARFEWRSIRGLQRIFDASVATDSLDVDETWGEAFVGVHGRAWLPARLGALVSRRSVTRDVEAQQRAVMLTGAWMRRQFRTLQNVDRFATSEDLAAGLALQVGLGADHTGLGATRDRALYRADAQFARFLGASSLAGLVLRHHGFLRDGRVENGRGLAEAYGFWKRGPHVFAWNVGAAALIREPEYWRFAIGSDARLRGYPARFLNGTRAAWINAEQRLFSDVRLLFMRFGAAAFLDVAQAWESDEAAAWDRFRVGGGVGLRIGNNKSGLGVTRIDFSFGRGFEIVFASGAFVRTARTIEWPDPGLYTP